MMGHGTACSCGMCGMGKKLGMIKNEDGKKEQGGACPSCGHEHGEEGTCGCGCA